MPLPDQLQKGHTFADGDTVNAALLNSIVDEATMLKGAIGEQTVVTADPADYVLITDTSAAGALKKALVSSVVGTGGVTSVAMAGVPAGVFDVSVADPTGAAAILLKLDQQEEDSGNGRNKILASPEDGSMGYPSFRRLLPKDVTQPHYSLPTFVINCTFGSFFSKQVDMTGNHFFTLNNGISGQTVKVWVQRTTGSGTLTWSSDGDIHWPGGVVPILTAGANKIDIFTFAVFGDSHYYGTVDHDFRL